MKPAGSVYSFSFTGANALIRETVMVAEKFQLLNDWDAVTEIVFGDNLLHKQKKATIKRELQEIRKRIDSLTPVQLQLLISGSSEDTKAMILLSLVKAYDIFSDFILEIIRPKYLKGDTLLLDQEYKSFIEEKSGYHPELHSLSPSTSVKVKTVILRMLAQVGLLSSPRERMIMRPLLGRQSVDAVRLENRALLKMFLYSDREIERLIG